MNFIKKHIWNIIFGLFIVILVFNPFGLGFTIKSKINQLFSFSPSVTNETDRKSLVNYDWNIIKNNETEVLDFNDFKGKVVLVNFWATWCPPCIAEMPSLQNLYNDYGDKIEFVLLANDEKAKVDAFLKNNAYTMPIYFEQSNSPEEFKTSSIPATFLIDKKGNIIIEKTGAADWNSRKTREIIDDLL